MRQAPNASFVGTLALLWCQDRRKVTSLASVLFLVYLIDSSAPTVVSTTVCSPCQPPPHALSHSVPLPRSVARPRRPPHPSLRSLPPSSLRWPCPRRRDRVPAHLWRRRQRRHVNCQSG